MAALTIADFTPALKVISEKLSVVQYDRNPVYALIPKQTSFGGRFVSIPLRYSNSPDGSADDTVAFSTTVSGQAAYTEFQLTPGQDYARSLLRGVTMAVSEGDKNAVITAMKATTQAMQNTAARSIGAMTFGNGDGIRGSGAQTADTLQLADPQQIVNFEVGMRVNVLVDTSSTSAILYGIPTYGTYTIISAINRSTGLITFIGTLAAANNYSAGATRYLVRQGDVTNSGTAVTGQLLPKGISGWVPYAAPGTGNVPAAWFNVTRTTDITRLGGLRYTGGGAPPEETLIRAAALIEREGGMADTCAVNTADFADLQLSRESKVVITADAGGKSKVSFTAISVSTGYGKDIKVLPDVNCPKGKFHILQMDTWKFRSAGKYMALVNADGNSILRQAGADAYEMRLAGYGQFSCDAPGWNLAGTW